MAFVLIWIPLVMVLIPAVFTLFVKTRVGSGRDEAEVRRQVRSLRLRLWVATALAVALEVGLGLVARYPFMMYLFFPLWFFCAMPLLRVQRPGWFFFDGDTSAIPATEPTTRRVSLQPQPKPEATSSTPTSHFNWWPHAIGAVIVLGVVGFYWSDITARHGTGLVVGGLFVWLFFGSTFLAIGECGWQGDHAPPVLRGPRPDAEVDRLNAQLQRFQRRVWYGFATAVVIFMTAVGLAFAFLPPRGDILGLVGGIGGTAIGILGGGFGVIHGCHQARIRERIFEITHENAAQTTTT